MKRLYWLPFVACAVILIVEQIANQLRPVAYEPWVIGTLENPDKPEETLILPVNAEQDVFTSQQYSGSVTITVRGEGRIDEHIHHDAFYTYEPGDTVAVHFDGFIIDGEGTLLPVFTGVPPRFSPNHEYSFLYRVGDNPRSISFKMANENEADISSQFEIEMSIFNKVTSPGR